MSATVMDETQFRVGVDSLLKNLLDDKRKNLSNKDVGLLLERLSVFVLGGGKRLRSAFCYWGWQGAGGSGSAEGVIRAAASLELLHAFALLQDDIIDHSATRRGLPAMHRQLAELHQSSHWHGPAADFGIGGAMMLSNLCLVWSSMLLHEASEDAQQIGTLKALHQGTVADATYGEVLELILQSERRYDKCHCMEVVRYKAGRYMFMPALLMGAVLANARPEVFSCYQDFGIAIGDGYQLRDDLLGAFGNPSLTGKPNTDDFREGKPTVLIAEALQRFDGGTLKRAYELYGNPHISPREISELRDLLRTSGAVAAIERLIRECAATGATALTRANLATNAKEEMTSLAQRALQRSC
ncbi:polyprenyl synthetase family protein [Streptomyces sp. ET3-23]|uniref:polyprenyl synthetase family protein n=1 Tax=Streptomyces sp. ET3-23 TaxID=2885643 RepID=UPI001D1227E9|nr:polyprenyl synthetase family protein [Streptomyces sp. ET3-23]MCC2280931.1 polyprenyl synthetase family protein [Streptomyces sp. ET3-23]